jgi:hypothetical protein
MDDNHFFIAVMESKHILLVNKADTTCDEGTPLIASVGVTEQRLHECG